MRLHTVGSVSVGMTLALASLVACSSVREPDHADEGASLSGFTASGDGASATEGADASGRTDDDDDGAEGAEGPTGADSSAEDTGSIRFDVGPGRNPDGGTVQGCGKIDFLFVIDNSGSMRGKQENLVNSFPGFISTIRDVLEIEDYHIMAVTTDDGTGLGCTQSNISNDCASWCQNCVTGSCACSCGPSISSITPCPAPPSSNCDKVLGAGKVTNLNGAACQIQGNQRYLVQGQPNLGQTFDCIARQGTAGSGDERPMGGMTGALSQALLNPGGCNDGFVRDDAILVVTVITDEEDDPNDMQGSGCRAIDGDPNSQGGPAAWRDAVVAAKKGDERAVVMLGLVGDCDVPGGVCTPLVQSGSEWTGAEPSPRLRQFTEMFSHGMWASVCEPDYSLFFQEAVAVIDTACEDFNPPG